VSATAETVLGTKVMGMQTAVIGLRKSVCLEKGFSILCLEIPDVLG
jgi:hypothetical protein